MPRIELTDDELQRAAQAARIALAQAESDAAKQSSPEVRQMFAESAARKALGAKFEQARNPAIRGE